MRKCRLACTPDHRPSLGLGEAGLAYCRSPQAPEKAPFSWLGTWEFGHRAQVRQPRPQKECGSAWGLAAGQRRPMPQHLGPHTGGGPRPRSACGRRPWYRWPAGEEAAASADLVRPSCRPRASSAAAASPQLSPSSGLRREFEPDPGRARLYVQDAPWPRLCRRTIRLSNTLSRITRGGFPTWCPASPPNVPAWGSFPGD